MCCLADNLKSPSFPSTRFMGSKAKLSDWIWSCIKDIEFDSVLDAFGGTASFSYLCKSKNKQVTFNDALSFNYNVALSIIENSDATISPDEIEKCMSPKENFAYKRFIERTFSGIYFTDDENKWLDIVIQNIHSIENRYKRALFLSALGQSCLIKRPFNLFHRCNLNLRTRDVKRTFFNKTCWDKPFSDYFQKFINEYSNSVFSNKRNNSALGMDVFDLPTDFDLVYLDPPYMSGNGGIDYLDMYHFLEGLVGYYSWIKRIDFSRKNLPMKHINEISVWQKKNMVSLLLDKLFEKFSGSTIVFSYRSNGYPTSKKIIQSLRKHRGVEPKVFSTPYKYALSKNQCSELLFIA